LRRGRGILIDIGTLDPASSEPLGATDDVERAIRQRLGERCLRQSISGVPTFVFAEKYAVSGAQPAEQLARAIRQVSAEVNAQAAE
jgi:predicted DsbA family dithiol-disulfide isomerase